MDSGRFGFDSDEPEPMGPGGKCEGFGRFKRENSARKAGPNNSSNCPGGRSPFGAISPDVWVESGPVGWADAGVSMVV